MVVDSTVWKILQKRQRYAGHWEALSKPEKEVLVVYDLLCAIHEQEGRAWTVEIKPGPCANEPPDVVGITNNGARVAFEVTELVDQTMIERRAKGKAVGKDWNPDEVISRLQSKLDEKGLRRFSKKDFDSIVLVIHTAEPNLRPSKFGSIISSHRFIRQGQIDEAYLIFPPGPPRLLYSPELRVCRYFCLSLR